MEPIDFKCEMCGECCKHTHYEITIGGQPLLVGLQIQLDETDFLRSRGMVLLPQIGGGMKGDKRFRPKKVYTYQMVTDSCPLMSANKICSIHLSRPRVCRAYPIQDQAIPDPRCTFLKRHIASTDSEGTAIFSVPIRFAEQLEAHDAVYEKYESVGLHGAFPLWIFDLKTRKWYVLSQSDMLECLTKNV